MSKSGNRDWLEGYCSPRMKDGGFNYSNTTWKEAIESRRDVDRLLKMKGGSS